MKHGFAHLSWYDFSRLQEANNSFWKAIRQECLRKNPELKLKEELVRDLDSRELWNSPDCFFTQACGYDIEYRHNLPLICLAAPIHEIPGCEGHLHSAFLVIKQENKAREIADLLGSRAVINCWMSNSGMNLLRHSLAPVAASKENFLTSIEVSGAHRESLRMIQDNKADLASIDCITWYHLKRFEPAELEGLRILAQSALCPMPPLCTSTTTSIEDREILLGSIERVLELNANSQWVKDLGYNKVKRVENSEYLALRRLHEEAVNLGYEIQSEQNQSSHGLT